LIDLLSGSAPTLLLLSRVDQLKKVITTRNRGASRLKFICCFFRAETLSKNAAIVREAKAPDDEKEVEPGYFVPIYVYPEIEVADQQHNSHGQLSQGPDDQRAPAADPIGSDDTDDQRRDQEGSPNQRIVD
jgi:hypothetical protein